MQNVRPFTATWILLAAVFFTKASWAQGSLQNLYPGNSAVQEILQDGMQRIDWKDSAFSPLKRWNKVQFRSEVRISFPQKLKELQDIADGKLRVEIDQYGVRNLVPVKNRVKTMGAYNPINGSLQMNEQGHVGFAQPAAFSSGDRPGAIEKVPVYIHANNPRLASKGGVVYGAKHNISPLPKNSLRGEKLSFSELSVYGRGLMLAPNLPAGDPGDFIITYDDPHKKVTPVHGSDNVMTEAYSYHDGKRSSKEFSIKVEAPAVGAKIAYGLESTAKVEITIGILKNDLIKAGQEAGEQLPYTIDNMILKTHSAYKDKFWVQCTRSFSNSLERAYAGSLAVATSFSPVPGLGLSVGATFTKAHFRGNDVVLPPAGELAYTKLEDSNSYSTKHGGFNMEHYFNLCWSKFTKKDLDRIWRQSKGFYSPIFQNLIYKAETKEEACHNVGEMLPLGYAGIGEQRECMQLLGHPKGFGAKRHVWTGRGNNCYLYQDGTEKRSTDKAKKLNPETNRWEHNKAIGYYRFKLRSFNGAHHCSARKKLRCAGKHNQSHYMTSQCVTEKTYGTYLKNGWMSWD